MAFNFVSFSPKQLQLLNWWHPDAPENVRSHDIVIADGAIRSGKTVSMICSFVLWSQRTFTDQAFIIAGKSIGALKRNVVQPLTQILEAWGWNYTYNRSEHTIKIGTNFYYLFGANNEASQDILQGLTAAGAYADEVALFPPSFVNQMIGRCSVAESRIFMNCNPAGGTNHHFYQEYILKHKEKNIFYMHFLMDDNYSLPLSTKQRYERAFSGTFYNRNVLGRWVVTEGLIYQKFADNTHRYIINREDIPNYFEKILIGVDWGDNKSSHTFVAVGITPRYSELIALLSEKHSAKNLTPTDIEILLVAFVRKVIARYRKVDMINCDHINTLINGCRVALQRANLRVPIGQAYKAPIIERITTTLKLIGLQRFRLTRGCKELGEALQTAVWDPDRSDVRLDDGSSDVDTLDAFEYSFSGFLDMFAMLEERDDISESEAV